MAPRWQWVLWVVLIGLTFFASLSTPLAVMAVGAGANTSATDVNELVQAFDKAGFHHFPIESHRSSSYFGNEKHGKKVEIGWYLAIG